MYNTLKSNLFKFQMIKSAVLPHLPPACRSLGPAKPTLLMSLSRSSRGSSPSLLLEKALTLNGPYNTLSHTRTLLRRLVPVSLSILLSRCLYFRDCYSWKCFLFHFLSSSQSPLNHLNTTTEGVPGVSSCCPWGGDVDSTILVLYFSAITSQWLCLQWYFSLSIKFIFSFSFHSCQ